VLDDESGRGGDGVALDLPERIESIICRITGGKHMKKNKKQEGPFKYPKKPKREKLTTEETIRRMQEFPKRKEKILAAIGKS
jgi:hypothetical protein